MPQLSQFFGLISSNIFFSALLNAFSPVTYSSLRILFLRGHTFNRRKKIVIKGNAKCHYLKNITCKGTYSQREGGKGGGGRVEPERRLEGHSSQSWFDNTNRTDCISSL